MAFPHRLFFVLIILTVGQLLCSCSQAPPPITGHATTLKDNLPVYEPFAPGPLQNVGMGALAILESPADVLFDRNVTTVRIKISASEWENLVNDANASGNRSGIKRLAHAVVGDSLVQNVGLSFMGRGSLKIPANGQSVQRTNFKIDFGETFSADATVFGSAFLTPQPENEGRNFLGMPSLILKVNDRDETYVRPYLVAEMMREFGVPTPRIGFAALYLDITNQDSKYLGVYALHEFIDEAWFNRQLGPLNCIYDVGKGDTGYGYLDASNDYLVYLNEVSPCDQGVTGIPILNDADPRWTGQEFHPTYSFVGGDKDCEECEDHLNFLILLSMYSDKPETISDSINLETMLRYMTISAFVGNVDDFWIFGNNVFLCRSNKRPKGTWTTVPIDFDLTFNQEFSDARNPSGSVLNYGMGSILGGKILSHEGNRDLYKNLVWTWYQALESRTTELRVREAVAIISEYLNGYDVDDVYPYSEEAVQELIRFSGSKMEKARNELKFDHTNSSSQSGF